MFNKKILLVVLSVFSRGIHAGQPFTRMDDLTTEHTNYSRALSTQPSFDSVVYRYSGNIFGMTTDLYPGGNNAIYFVDLNNHRVLKLNKQFDLILSWGGHFNHPMDVAVDSYHNVYVADFYGNQLQKFDSDGNHLLTFSPPSSFHKPSVVKVDCDGDIWVGDRGNQRIMKFKNDGTFISYHDLGYIPGDFEFDSDGNIHVIDHKGSGAKMVKYDSNFNKLFDYALGSWPNYVAIDCNGYLYVTEFGGGKVSIWTKDGQAHSIPSFGSKGNGNGQFQNAVGIFIDGSDAYVSDYTNMNIQKFSLNNGCSEGPGPLAMSCPISGQTSAPTTALKPTPPTLRPAVPPTPAPIDKPSNQPSNNPTVCKI